MDKLTQELSQRDWNRSRGGCHDQTNRMGLANVNLVHFIHESKGACDPFPDEHFADLDTTRSSVNHPTVSTHN